MTEVAIEIDSTNRDVLFARRVELFFEPNPDGTESLSGRVVWHTEWWHYSGDVKRAQTMGPRIERQVASLLSESYPAGEVELSALQIIAALKSAYVAHARAHLGLSESSDPE